MKYSNDSEEELTPVSKLGFSVKTRSSHIFNVNITTEIYGPDHYTEIFQLLMEAGPEDIVQFHINSPGGRLDGLSMILEGINLTEANTTAIIIGNAHSAASILAMAVDDVLVMPSAEMLCHNARYGIGGKSSDIEAVVSHNKKTNLRLFDTYYEGFLSKQEIQDMLQGKEIYLDATEIEERFTKRADYFRELEEKEIEAAKSAEVAGATSVQSEKRGSKSTKKQQTSGT